MTARRKFSAPEKVQILRLHLLENKPISQLCQQYQLNPTIFYRWQKELFDHGTAAFERAENGGADQASQRLQKENTQLKAKLAFKDEVIAEIMAEQVRLKKHLAWTERGLGTTRYPRRGGRLCQILEQTHRHPLSPDHPVDRYPPQQVLPVAATLRDGQSAQWLDPEGLLA